MMCASVSARQWCRNGQTCAYALPSPPSIIPMETSGWSMARQPNLIFHYSVCSILCQGKSAFLQYIKYAGFKLITDADSSVPLEMMLRKSIVMLVNDVWWWWWWRILMMVMMMTVISDDGDDDGDRDDGDDAGDILWCPFLFCSSPLGTLEPTSSSSKQTLCLPRMCYSVIIYSRFFTLRSSQNTLIRQQWLCILYYALQSGGGQWLKAKGRWQKGGSGWGATVASHLKGHQCPMKSSILLAVAHKEQPMQYS